MLACVVDGQVTAVWANRSGAFCWTVTIRSGIKMHSMIWRGVASPLSPAGLTTSSGALPSCLLNQVPVKQLLARSRLVSSVFLYLVWRHG